MRLLVFGSRTFGVIKNKYDREDVVRALLQRKLLIDVLANTKNVSTLIHGGAKGADDLADLFMSIYNNRSTNKVEILIFKADWNRYGKSAGPFRNRQMISEGRPDRAMGFIDRESDTSPISPGSKNMYQQLLNNHIPVELFQ